MLEWEILGYKVLARVSEGRYVNFFDADNMLALDFSRDYRLASPVVDEAKDRHRGGCFVYNTALAAAQMQVPPVLRWALPIKRRAAREDVELVILRCACSGPFVSYDGGVVACSRVVPLEEVPTPGFGPLQPHLHMPSPYAPKPEVQVVNQEQVDAEQSADARAKIEALMRALRARGQRPRSAPGRGRPLFANIAPSSSPV